MSEELQPHQQRVLAEKRELDERVEKLTSFVNSENISKASFKEQGLLREQLAVMCALQEILQERINLW
jgi:hypothetical protein